MNERASTERFVELYSRELPGGGQVTIEARGATGQPWEARVMVERRCDPRRREGHAPPVIAEVEQPTQAVAFRELYTIASDNVAIARGLITWQTRQRPA